MNAGRTGFLVAALFALGAVLAASAHAQRAREVPKYDMSGRPYRGGDIRAYGQHDHAFRRPYDHDFHGTHEPKRRHVSPRVGGHRGHDHDHHHHHGHGFYPYYPAYPSYGYYSDFYYDGWPGYYDPGPVYLPPVTVPAETWFGPQAVQRFLGMNAVLGAHAARQELLDDPDPVLVVPEPERFGDVRDRRVANAASIARARRLIGFGDANFEEQQWHAALERYKDAMRAAPTLAEAYFRQGHAYTVLGMYPQAVLAYQRGLKLQPDWPQSNFDLVALYDENVEAFITSRERLAAAAADDPQNADLLFLIGVQLHFSGERERARLFFRRAAALTDDDAHLDAFLAIGAANAPGPREF